MKNIIKISLLFSALLSFSYSLSSLPFHFQEGGFSSAEINNGNWDGLCVKKIQFKDKNILF